MTDDIPCTLLLIDSDPDHSNSLTAVLTAAGYAVRTTLHEICLPLIQDGAGLDGVILCTSSEPSTLSAQDRLGDFVLRFTTHVSPALLPRTIVLTALPPDQWTFPDACTILPEPFDESELLRLVALRCHRR